MCWQQLEIYEMIGHAISNSRRAGGEVSNKLKCYSRIVKKFTPVPFDLLSLCHLRTLPFLKFTFLKFLCALQHYQNFQLLGAWCLLNSLYLILNLSPTALADKGKEKDPLAALRVRDIAARTKDGAGSPKLGPGKG